MRAHGARQRLSGVSCRERSWGLRRRLLVVGAAALCSAPGAWAQDGATAPPADVTGVTGAAQVESTPRPEDGPSYPISAFELRYLREAAEHPPLEDVMQIEVELAPTRQGYVVPRPGEATTTIRLADVAARPLEVYYASAIQRVLERVRDHFTELGLIGLYVTPDPFQINELGDDLRPANETRLTLVITTGIVSELRTLASGERIDPRERVNHPLHERIRRRSPIQPADATDPERASLLRKDALDRYVFFLSRHPGRRVDVGLSAGLEPGTGALDYIITENNPLVLYAQVSNTGTDSTSEWRERFGLFHTQLTNNDDVLSLDYSTASFDDTHAVAASYEAPFANDRIRWRVQASYSQYEASDVGFFLDDFSGESWSIGAELSANIYQDREFFIDLFGGARFEDVSVDNDTLSIGGDEEFVYWYGGLRMDRTTEWYSTQASVLLEAQFGDVTDVDPAELVALGRTSPDDDWLVLRWDVTHSFYLEPLVDREAWEDPTTPESSTLAHEILLSFKGQYAFENRLIPQAEQVVGGLYTVRGYDESIVAADTALIGSVEYRYHVPRAFKIQPEPRELFGQPFRAAPQYVYGQPDWDWLLKAFFDIGFADISDNLAFEDDETLMGIGIGTELLYRRNLRVRLDWGIVLEGLEGRGVDDGDDRLHVVATLLF